MKKIWTILLGITFLLIGAKNVEAIYNGSGSTLPPLSGGSCNGYSRHCTYNNTHFTAVQLTLIYYDGTSWTQIGRSHYIINENSVGMTSRLQNNVGTTNVEVNNKVSCCYGKCTIDSKGYSAAGPGDGRNCGYNYAWLRDRYSDDSTNKAEALKNMNNLLSAMGVKPSDLTRPHNGTVNYNSRGYRILIEPVMNFIKPNSTTANVFMTIKEVYKAGGVSNKDKFGGHSTLLYTDKDDIGVRAPAKDASGNPIQSWDATTIGNDRWGYGYNIINPVQESIKQCYKMVINAKNPKCTNTNEQNEGFYQETFTSEGVSCEDKALVVENATSYGRLVKTVNKDCKIYCTEEVQVKYPGNVLPAIQTGGKFVWPTFGNSKNDIHNLNIIGKRNCTVVGSGCGSSKVTVNDLYKNFESDITLKFKQENYKDNIKLAKAQNISTCNGCTDLYDQKQITVTHDIKLKLPKNTYRYINNQTKIASSTMNGDSSLYTDVGYGNLPISNNAKTEGNYNLEFTNIGLGEKGIFSTVANKEPYKCTYKAKNTPNSCICPPGTSNAGKDLWCILASSNDLNCPTAQQQYCNTEWNIDEDTCLSKYCDPPYQHVSLESCVSAGNSYNACKAKLCNGGGKKYECPKNTPNEFMDISWCVENLIAKGQSEKEAIKICQDVVCPATGIPIIYRTISLKNPFPSKNLNGGISGFNTDNISGRYPGTNWNSRKLVEVEIRNNRGVKDNAVYNKKPLYKIVLNAETMRKVRKYNDDQARGAGYSDFTLNCKGKTVNAEGETIKDGSKCFSDTFLRSTLGTALQGGTCANASASTFDSCAS